VRRLREKAPTRTAAHLTKLLDAHAAQGRLRDVNLDFSAQAFGGMVLAFGVIAPLLRGEPARDPESTARALTDLFLQGVTR
jgi:hypothetical protein